MTEEELSQQMKNGEVEEITAAEQASPTDDNEVDFLQTTLADYESFLNLLKRLKQYNEDAPTYTPKSFIEQFYFRVEGAGGTNTLYAHFNGGWNAFPQATSDHGALNGLADDDHAQYHTDARGDARYYTETELNAGQLDNRYYTETELNAGQLDTRYYTETEVDAFAVKLTGNQTVADVKTFSSFPVTPSSAPTSDYQVANKKYVDDNVPETKYLGVGSTANKTYFNFTMPWRIMAANEPVWDFNYVVITEQALGHIYFYKSGAAPGYIQTQYNIFGLDFADTKKIILEMVVQVTNVAQTYGWGLCEYADDFGDAVTTENAASVHFAVCDGGSGNLYAVTSDGDGNFTNETISGITFSNRNLYRIEWNPGVSALFYVNGVLKKTLTTNLPSSGDMKLGIGVSGDHIFASAPHFAVEI